MHLAFQSARGRRRTTSAPPARVQVAHPRRRRHRQQQPMSPHTTRNPTIPTAAQIRMFVIAHLVSLSVVRNPLASRPPSQLRLSSRRRTLCTIPFSLYVGKTTKSKPYRITCASARYSTLPSPRTSMPRIAAGWRTIRHSRLNRWCLKNCFILFILDLRIVYHFRRRPLRSQCQGKPISISIDEKLPVNKRRYTQKKTPFSMSKATN